MIAASSKLQPPLASTYNSSVGASSRTAINIARSASTPSGLPNLTLSTLTEVKFSQSCTLILAASGELIPIVTEVGTMRSRSNPHSCHNGNPTRFPSQSCNAISNAACAEEGICASCIIESIRCLSQTLIVLSDGVIDAIASFSISVD